MTEMSVRQWQERFRAGDFSSKDRAVQCEAGWYDWFCQDDALAGRLQKLSKVVMGITDPYILDNYYVWFKNNCPLSGPLYDDVRFEPLHGDRNGRYFVVIRDSPHETHKWTIYTERHGFEQPEFTCANVRDMNCCFAATQAEMALPPSSPRKGSRYMAYFGGSHRAVSGLSISMRDIPTYTKKSLLLCGIMQGGS